MSLKARFSGSAKVFLLFCAVTAGAVGAPSVESVDGRPIGVVIETVDPGLALDLAGVIPGDVFVWWRREAKAPNRPDGAEGFFSGPFDLYEVEQEQPARGELRIGGTRDGERFEVVVPPGFWGGKAIPLMISSTRSAGSGMGSWKREKPMPAMAERITGLKVIFFIRKKSRCVDRSPGAKV